LYSSICMSKWSGAVEGQDVYLEGTLTKIDSKVDRVLLVLLVVINIVAAAVVFPCVLSLSLTPRLSYHSNVSRSIACHKNTASQRPDGACCQPTYGIAYLSLSSSSSSAVSRVPFVTLCSSYNSHAGTDLRHIFSRNNKIEKGGELLPLPSQTALSS